MSTITTLLKASVLVCTTVLLATSASAHHKNSSSSSSSGSDYSNSNSDDSNTVTVEVYEKGYFPNIAYMDGMTYVKFVNMTQFRLGLDFDNNGVVVDSFDGGDEAIIDASYLEDRTIYAPYFEDYNRYIGSRTFEVDMGSAPDGS